MEYVKVLMVGGPRAGKSSLLASLDRQLTYNEEIRQFMRMSSVRNNRPIPESLDDKQNDLESFLSKPKNNLYLVDFRPDTTFSYYPFEIKVKKTNEREFFGKIGIEFIDCPGESYNRNSREDYINELSREIPDTNVFIIVIDTPYLMDPQSDSGKFKKVNEVLQIDKIIDINILGKHKRDDDYTKIIFVPVKCEAWKDRLDKVAEKLQHDDYYGVLINKIKKDKTISCCIIPAFTAGGIEFAEFSKPMLLDGEKCAPLGTKRVRMWDGEERELPPNVQPVPEDHEDNDKKGNFKFPFYSWFENTGTYEPKYCDQIALQVSRFIVFRALVESSHKIFPRWIHGFPSGKRMKELIHNLEKNLQDEKPVVHIRKIETDKEIDKY